MCPLSTPMSFTSRRTADCVPTPISMIHFGTRRLYLQLIYQDQMVGRLDSDSAFTPANDDAVFLNCAMHQRLAA